MASSWQEVAKAYVTIIPNMKGATDKIKQDLGGTVSDAVEQGGEEGGHRLGDILRDTINTVGLGAVLTTPLASALTTAGIVGAGNINGSLLGILGTIAEIRSALTKTFILAAIVGANQLSGAFRSIFKTIGEQAGKVVESSLVQGMIRAAKNGGKVITNNFKSIFRGFNIGSDLATQFDTPMAKVWSLGQKLVESIKQSKIGQVVQDSLNGAISKAVKSGSRLLETPFGKAFANIGSKFVKTMGEASGKAGEGFKKVFSKVSDYASSNLGPTIKKIFSRSSKEAGNSVTSEMTRAGETGGQRMSDGISGSIKNIAIGSILAAGIIGAVGAVTSAVHDVFSAAFNGFASNEQLVGGVETLFKDAAGTVIDNANQAFFTAGMDANTYMEQSTSFAASLISSLGGDAQKAAEIADMAMRDMSDNANKMGSSLESITGAYQSLARGNYGMLDNLKLGYGGTKSELERLVADANKLAEANGMASDMTIDSFADVITSIHLIQENLQITGTTALEASTTIEGSFNTLNAAWSNWLTGLGQEDADFGQLTENLVTSLGNAMTNAIPRWATIFATLFTAGPELISAIAEATPGLLKAIVDSIEAGLANTPFAGFIPWIRDSIFGENGLIAIFEQVTQKVNELAGPILEALEGFITAMLERLAPLKDNFGTILSAAIDGLFEALGNLATLIEPLLNVVLDVFDAVMPIFVEFFGMLRDFMVEHGERMAQFFSKLGETIQRVFNVLSPILERVLGVISHLIETLLPLLEPILDLICAALDLLAGVLEYLWGILRPIIDVVLGLFEAIIDLLTPVVGVIIEFIANIVKWFGDMSGAAGNTWILFEDFFEGLGLGVDSIREVFSAVFEFITAPFKLAFNTVATLWNDTIGQLSWEVPDWVPVLGGQTISAPQLPMLAEGAVVTKATQAIIGEAGPEAVIPLDSPKTADFFNASRGGFDDTQDIKQAIYEALQGWSFQINGQKMANATRGNYDVADGKANVLLRRGLTSV